MRLASIQVLRGIAASMIFIFHLVVTLDRYSETDLRPLVAYLPLGVDLFFLISGFVMAHSVRNVSGPRAALDFLTRRAWRIVPLLYGVTAAAVAVRILLVGYVEPARIINSITVLPLLSTVSQYQFALIPAWTLAYEAAFYFMIAIVVALNRGRLAMILLVLPFALVFPKMLEFAAGVALYELWTTVIPRFAKVAGEWTPASYLGRFGLWLGTISYSLYLTHVVTFDAVAPIFAPLGVAPLGAALAITGLLIAWLVYESVEAPLMRLAQRRHHRISIANPLNAPDSSVMDVSLSSFRLTSK